MKILLSIKPKYVREIINGKKKYEFRTAIFKERYSNEILVYSSTPVKKIVGKFKIGRILEDIPDKLWERVKDGAGIDYEEFSAYFKDKPIGFAIEIVGFVLFEKPIDPKILDPNFVSPQSYLYIEDSFFAEYIKQGGNLFDKTVQREL